MLESMPSGAETEGEPLASYEVRLDGQGGRAPLSPCCNEMMGPPLLYDSYAQAAITSRATDRRSTWRRGWRRFQVEGYRNMTQCEHLDSSCLKPPGHDDDVKCRFLCSDCGEEYETDEGRCIRELRLEWTVGMPISTDIREAQTRMPTEVKQAIGEILMDYALAENTLREVLQQLPEHRERSYISEDLKRLEKWLPHILEQTPGKDWQKKWRGDFDECVKDLRRALDAVYSKRNALAHGQLVGNSSWTEAITASGKPSPSQPGGTWYKISHPLYGSVALTEPELSEVSKAAKELCGQIDVLQRLAQVRRGQLDTPED